MTRLAAVVALSLGLAGGAQADPEPLRLLVWSDYLPPGAVELFTAETGIPVILDTYENAEAVEALLLARGSGYDLAIVSSEYLGRLIEAGALRRLGETMQTRLDRLDPAVMDWLAELDPANRHAVPYLWGTTGIGFDRAAADEHLPGIAMDSWKVIFDPAIVSRMAGCGVALIDSVEEVAAAALLWLGLRPNDASPEAREQALEAIAAIAPYVRRFDSGFLAPLQEGRLCLVLGWSVDVLAAAADAGDGRDIAYAVPREGAPMWIDSFVLPADADRADAAERFIAFMLEPAMNAAAASYSWGAGAVPEARAFLPPSVLEHPDVVPDTAALKRLVLLRSVPPEQKARLLQGWSEIKVAPGSLTVPSRRDRP